ncbi:MAG: inositol monophosphatase, partial [SAR202 cluster bacterium]|nr:inositol monophosphatase [SAR202 cluster bacterium]
MQQQIDEQVLIEIEQHAIDIARQGGAILGKYFGQNIKIEYKDKRESDPVSQADHETQDYLYKAIEARFPEHGILGEEDDKEKREDTSPAPDFLWVLDPLDGTKNFLHGLPVYACSVGVLHKGAPVAGAVFVPWPADGGGIVFHARKGGGAFADSEPISVHEAEEPRGNVMVTLPGYFRTLSDFKKPMRGKVGELRVTGSIAYELVMVSRGITQYMITTGPHLWDIVGGVAVAMEAGSALFRGTRTSGPMGMFPSIKWEQTDTLVPDWKSGTTSGR